MFGCVELLRAAAYLGWRERGVEERSEWIEGGAGEGGEGWGLGVRGE